MNILVALLPYLLAVQGQQSPLVSGGQPVLASQGQPRADGEPQKVRRPPRPQQAAGFGSFLSTFLGSVTQTETSDACPGKCIHSLASLMCDEVREEVACPSAQMRCCVEKSRPSRPTRPANKDDKKETKEAATETTTKKEEKEKEDVKEGEEEEEVEEENEDTKEERRKKKKEEKRKKKKNRTTSTTTTSTTTTTTTTTTTSPKDEKADKSGSVDEEKSPEKSSATSCPGVCVAHSISCYCEAILDIDTLCKDDLRCCVAKKIYDNEETPEELIIPKEDSSFCNPDKEKKKTTTTEKTTTEKEVEEEEEEEEMMETSPSEQNTVVNGADKKTDEDEEGEEEDKEKDDKDSKKDPKEPIRLEIPPEKRCNGTCVTGFFAFLCDSIDKNAICPGNGSYRCCINQPPRPKVKKPSSKDPKPARRTTVRPPRRPQPPKQKCPGVCTLEKLCSDSDQVILGPCSGKGIVCCDQRQRDILERISPTTPRPPPPPVSKPASPLPSWMLPLIPGLVSQATGGSISPEIVEGFLPILTGILSQQQAKPAPRPRPPRPTTPPRRTTQRPTTTTTTQATTTTTSKPDPRPECPGTCIKESFVMPFICFGNAETTDLFKCGKRNNICCSPKKMIKIREDELLQERFSTNGRPGAPPQRIQNQNSLPNYEEPARNLYPDYPQNLIQVEQPREPATTPRPLIIPSAINKYTCGIKGTNRRRGRVVGGADGAPGEWCWQVALINSQNQYLCGGALIGTQWVLTAAHCVTNIVRSGDAIYVRVGDHDLTQKFGSPGAQTLRVATTYIHHNHNSQTLDNDIALLKLHSEAELKEGVCLVCLPARGTSQKTGKKCTVTGYGYMGETASIPLRIREARVPIVHDSECVRKINSVTEKIFILPTSSFCAGGEKGHDACQGDGGGPLVCEDQQGFHELTGLVSWGFGCGRKDVPGVYVKVSSFIGWINQIISVNN